MATKKKAPKGAGRVPSISISDLEGDICSSGRYALERLFGDGGRIPITVEAARKIAEAGYDPTDYYITILGDNTAYLRQYEVVAERMCETEEKRQQAVLQEYYARKEEIRKEFAKKRTRALIRQARNRFAGKGKKKG